MKKMAFYQPCREIKIMDVTLKYQDPGFGI